MSFHYNHAPPKMKEQKWNPEFKSILTFNTLERQRKKNIGAFQFDDRKKNVCCVCVCQGLYTLQNPDLNVGSKSL